MPCAERLNRLNKQTQLEVTADDLSKVHIWMQHTHPPRITVAVQIVATLSSHSPDGAGETSSRWRQSLDSEKRSGSRALSSCVHVRNPHLP